MDGTELTPFVIDNTMIQQYNKLFKSFTLSIQNIHIDDIYMYKCIHTYIHRLSITWATFQYKDHLSKCGYSHCKTKTDVRQSYLDNRNPYAGTMASLHWDVWHFVEVSGGQLISLMSFRIISRHDLCWHHLTHLPWTKWPPFRRQHVQTHFLEWKYLNFK